MTTKSKESVKIAINSKGFDYTFRYYSSFSSIKDKEFHVLREKYRQAAQELSDYLGLESE